MSRRNKSYKKIFGIDAPDDDFNEPLDVSKLKHLDTIDKNVESKCMTCQHYCKNGAEARITTVSLGETPWHVGANYCTLLGYYPLKKRFPVSINSPIGPDGRVMESPEVIECSEYKNGTFMKLRPNFIDPIEAGMSEAEENMNKTMENFHNKVIRSSGIPKERFSDYVPEPEPESIIEMPIDFGGNKIAMLPDSVGEIIEIACGPLKFKNGVDFIEQDGKVTWTNPAFMVGPHTLLTIKYNPKK